MSRPFTKDAALSRFKHYTGIDRAIAFSVFGRAWSAVAGVLNVALITNFLTRGEQGYYYTFSSLVALQIVFELGFSFVILQLAAHERAHLTIHEDGHIQGAHATKARLASVLQKAVRWYSIAAVLMAVVLLTIGWIFFSRENGTSGVPWRAPWIFIVLASSLTFQIDPVISFLEGCGKVVQVGQLRMMQGIIGSLLAWPVIVMHHGLFSPAAILIGQALTGAAFLYSQRGLLVPLMRLHPGEHSINWTKEIWPFQWRVAVSWASAYFIWQLMNPVLFAYCGPVEAGRFGMSLNIANSLGALALAWMSTKASPFGLLIARGDYASLDKLFFTALKQSSAILLLGVTSLLLGFPILFRFFPRFQDRVLPLPYFGIVLLTALCSHIVVSTAYYLRAHKKEPFLYFWVAIAITSVFTLLALAKHTGTGGVVIGYFICSGVLRVIAAVYVFVTKRREWHAPSVLEMSLPE